MNKPRRVKEAARQYVTDPPVATMSSKRQITIPAEVVRHLNLSPGAKFAVYVQDGAIVLRHRPGSWLEYVTSGPPIYGRTKEEVDSYIREVREGWDEHARRFEGDTYVEESD